MRTSPAPGARSSTSSNCSTSGPPWRWKRNAFMTPWESGHQRLEVELERPQHARVHIVGADQNGQLHDFARIEVALDLGEHRIRYRDVAGHRVGIGERGALARVEKIR